MNDAVNHPLHYMAHPSGFECITVARLLPFTTGNAVKYIWRAWDKGNLAQDLAKARWYLKDHLANGLAWHPPWRAVSLLERAVILDPNRVRSTLLLHIARGELGKALDLIDAVLAEGVVNR